MFERRARRQGFERIAGLDEAGRGPLAGPVVAAACILPLRIGLDGLIDSKKLTRARRVEIFEKLQRHPKSIIAVGICDADVIDEINVLQASLQAMREAVAALEPQPDYLLIDGSQNPDPSRRGETIVAGDTKCISIAAASIIAKETRDRIMEEYDRRYPLYGFSKHKGYGTELHRAALAQYGPCPIHRRSFLEASSKSTVGTGEPEGGENSVLGQGLCS